MQDVLNQLVRSLSLRGLEWLRQRIMDLPAPCPADHPDIGALALAGRVAPILSGYYGRISPLEVIVLRRLSPELVQGAALRVLEGERDQVTLDLVLAGRMVTPADPLWQLACEAIADDSTLPLATRLSLSDEADLWVIAERAVTMPTHHIDADYIAATTQLLMQMYQHGASRPRLSHPSAFNTIFANLQRMATWAVRNKCTRSIARAAFCLRLVDPEHDLDEYVAELIQIQRPDGSFPARLGFSTVDQDFGTGVVPTLLVAMALHSATCRRWKGPALRSTPDNPMRGVARHCADMAAKMLADDTPTLSEAALMTRATGRDWIGPISANHSSLTPRQSQELAGLCFRDPISARHIRTHLRLPDIIPGRGRCRVEGDWLRGKPVTIGDPEPKALLALWNRAAMMGDQAAFMRCVRIALHFQPQRTTPQIRAMTRQIATTALLLCDKATRDQIMQSLEQITLLAQLFEPRQQLEAAA